MHTSTADRLRAEIRAEMARQGFTQQSLAEATDMSAWALSRRLSGKSPFLFREVEVVAAALNVKLSDLAARTEDVPA